MPSYNVTLKRYLSQTAQIVLTVPDGEAPMSSLPDLDDKNIVWVNVSSIPQSHECALIAEPAFAEEPETVEEADETSPQEL